jgi:SAM-dependent methyltransferase
VVGAAPAADVAVIGAGSSGLAVMKELREQGVAAECFERGSDVGGLWRFENDSGLSAAYASLRTNVSRPRMEYPSFPMPASYGDFPHHSEMAAYLDAYARSFGLCADIRFGMTVERLEREREAGWRLDFADGSVRRVGAVVVATGVFWQPKLPAYPGSFAGEVSHSHAYRTPEPFADRRVVVVGSGQSAAEIAVEVSRVAARTFMSIRAGAHVLPRWIGAKPYDAADVGPLNRLPWRLLNATYRRRVDRELGPRPASWPLPTRRLLEGIPIVSSDLLPAVRSGDILIKPAIARLSGDRVRFADGSEEVIDRIISATGYQISLPFLSPSLLSAAGRDLPLYRRIVPPDLEGLFFAGFVDTPGGLLPVVEAQGQWIAAVLTGRLRLPERARMWCAIERAERRTCQRFPGESGRSIRCDPHAYRRLLRSDLGRASLRRGGSAAAAAGESDYVARNRALWERQSDPYQQRHGRQLDEHGGRAWGAWRIPEAELHVLGDVAGLDVLELGCGAARWSVALARAGARPVGVDISPRQLEHARRVMAAAGVDFPLIEANAESVPLPAQHFDVIVSDHGAFSVADPRRLAPECARLLRSGGLLAFSKISPLYDLAYDRSRNRVGRRLRNGYFELGRVDRNGAADFQLGYGAWIRLFRSSGFVIEDLIELRPPDDAQTSFDLAPLDWARRWPAEHIWKLRRARQTRPARDGGLPG